jgi:SAM-dependent methyltransferase
MHKEAYNFISFVKKQLWEYFINGVNVLDVGSGDVNGNNRQFFDPTCKYQGNDVFPGKNVDIVSKTSELPIFKPTFHTIISTECFQHDPEVTQSLKKIVSMLRPGGMFIFTCASTGRQEHGTRKHSPIYSFGTRGGLSKWKDHYKNLTFEDLSAAIPLDDTFILYRCYYDKKHNDLLFWGIKKGIVIPIAIPEYIGEFIEPLGANLPIDLPPSAIVKQLPAPIAVKQVPASVDVKQPPISIKQASVAVKQSSAPVTAPVEVTAPVTAPVEVPAPVIAPVEVPAPVTAPVEVPAPVTAPVADPVVDSSVTLASDLAEVESVVDPILISSTTPESTVELSATN